MGDRTTQPLLTSSPIQVFDVSCSANTSEPEDEEQAGDTQVILPLRGVFEVHVRKASVVADLNSAMIFRGGDDYRVAHPAAAGDESIVLVLSREIAENALGFLETAGVVRPSVQLAVRLLRSALRHGTIDRLEAEEFALQLLRGVVIGIHPAGPQARAPRQYQQQRVEQVRALLASSPTAKWGLADVAAAVSTSPYHLARQFRALTGESISRYLLWLRLGLALDRITEGERDLGRLSAELGFAHHSHFSARFRSVFGTTPRFVRDALTTGRLAELRTIVIAKARTAS